MRAVYKREMRAYLTSMTGYVFIAFILLLSGIYFTAYNLQYAYPIFGYSLSSVTIVFLIVVPILTMRVLAEERRQKTDQLLLTSPVKVGEIVLGKYLALLSVFLIPVAILCTYPLVMSRFGEVSMSMSYTAVLGFFLLGCADLAIGIFLSSVTESQIVAAVLTFGVLFLCQIMEGIESLFSQTASGSFGAISILFLALCVAVYMILKNGMLACAIGVLGEMALLLVYSLRPSLYEGAIQKILEVFNLQSHFSNFVDGMLDVAGVVYYLSVILIFLFLTVQSIQKRRWS